MRNNPVHRQERSHQPGSNPASDVAQDVKLVTQYKLALQVTEALIGLNFRCVQNLHLLLVRVFPTGVAVIPALVASFGVVSVEIWLQIAGVN